MSLDEGGRTGPVYGRSAKKPEEPRSEYLKKGQGDRDERDEVGEEEVGD